MAESSPSTPQNDSVRFASSLVDQVNKEDINSMIHVQREILSRFEKTNEMLINFNILSTARYDATVKDFGKHTKLLYDMKRDLDSIFKRIRTLKQRLGTSYPEAFAACNSVYDVPSEEDSDSEAECVEAEHDTPSIPQEEVDLLCSVDVTPPRPDDTSSSQVGEDKR